MRTLYKFVGIALVCLFALQAFKRIPQENILLQNIISKLLIYNTNEGPEKTYLHTDKDFYTNGETIWFKTYLVDGITHTKSDKSKVIYVELVNPQDSIIAKRKLYVDALGAAGDIKISPEIPQGDYKLRAYTKYMLNDDEPVVFEKDLPIFFQKVHPNFEDNIQLLPGTLNDSGASKEISGDYTKRPTIRFFPEGGHSVAGLPTTMGLEVADEEGNGVALKGSIKDQNGNIVTEFESLEFGLGSVNFVPRPNMKYFASVFLNNEELTFPVPEPVSKGYVLSVKNRSDDVLVQVTGNIGKSLEGTVLIGHLRGKTILKRVGRFTDKNAYGVRLLSDELESGVAHFTLFAPDGEPVCERLIFVNNPANETNLSISANVKNYGFREKVALDLALSDENGNPLKGNLSMGVVTSSNKAVRSATNIKSWLLLNSDLGGTVADPDYFFQDGSNERRFLLDALMLTHGWRRFIWQDFLEDDADSKRPYLPEKGIMITGKTYDFKKPDLPKHSKVTLNFLGNELVQDQKDTRDNGSFSFGPYIFSDTLDVVVQAIDPDTKRQSKQKNLSIIVDDLSPKLSIPETGEKTTTAKTVEMAQEYLKESLHEKTVAFQYDPKVTRLDEVVVTEKKKTRNQIITEVVGAELTSGPFSKRVFTDSIVNGDRDAVIDLLNKVPGINVYGMYPDRTIRVQGIRGAPLILVDGIPKRLEFLEDMRAKDVMLIDLVKGPDAAIFGTNLATGSDGSGVIAIYRNRKLPFDDIEPLDYPGVTNFEIPGFYKTREFYTPNYAEHKPEHEKPDYRTTLFWEPNLKIDKDGKTSIDFYTGDSSGSYTVKVEGMTDDGRPVSSLHTIEVQEPN